jgi:hypothetical protein
MAAVRGTRHAPSVVNLYGNAASTSLWAAASTPARLHHWRLERVAGARRVGAVRSAPRCREPFAPAQIHVSDAAGRIPAIWNWAVPRCFGIPLPSSPAQVGAQGLGAIAKPSSSPGSSRELGCTALETERGSRISAPLRRDDLPATPPRRRPYLGDAWPFPCTAQFCLAAARGYSRPPGCLLQSPPLGLPASGVRLAGVDRASHIPAALDPGISRFPRKWAVSSAGRAVDS